MAQQSLNLSRSVSEIVTASAFSEEELLDALELCASDWQLQITGKKDFSIITLVRLAESLDFSVENLLLGKVDPSSIRKRHNPIGAAALPERYSNSSELVCRARTVLNIIKFTDEQFGRNFSTTLLRKLQLRREDFSKPERLIHPFIITDLLKTCVESGIHSNHMLAMGSQALAINRGTGVDNVLAACKTPRKVYETLIEQVIGLHYDRLYHYRFHHFTKDDVIAEVSPQKDIHDALKQRVVGTRETCLYKQGVTASFLGHIGMKPATIRESSCMYLGDRCCTYHLSWPKPRLESYTRTAQRPHDSGTLFRSS